MSGPIVRAVSLAARLDQVAEKENTPADFGQSWIYFSNLPVRAKSEHQQWASRDAHDLSGKLSPRLSRIPNFGGQPL